MPPINKLFFFFFPPLSSTPFSIINVLSCLSYPIYFPLDLLSQLFLLLSDWGNHPPVIPPMAELCATEIWFLLQGALISLQQLFPQTIRITAYFHSSTNSHRIFRRIQKWKYSLQQEKTDFNAGEPVDLISSILLIYLQQPPGQLVEFQLSSFLLYVPISSEMVPDNPLTFLQHPVVSEAAIVFSCNNVNLES